jgi:hypothetical protein
MSEWLQQELPPLQTLLDYLELKAELLQANRKMLKLYVSGIGFGFGTFSSGLPPDIREAQFRFLRSEAEVFRSAIETGDIRPELEPFDLAVSYENIANGFIQLDLEFPELHPFEAKIPGILRMFFSSAVTAKAEPLIHSRLNRYAPPEGEAS